ncbi:hypothetical protein ACJIZ3_000189 [Penstemon smallii]|uniref:Werner Syndrome-like exonuclease n=1 Tax=Penstemon smallii TaxID=265156 RepID=A0ABD3RC50_9LAMI
MIQVTLTKKVNQMDWWITSRILPLIQSHPGNKFVVGLDTEWRPNLKPSEDHAIAILQLSVCNECLIYQILHELFSMILILCFVVSGSKKMSKSLKRTMV